MTLERLFRFVSSPGERDALAEEGLNVGSGLERWEYEATPANAWTFASTGSDGVHFSLVDRGDGPSEGSPVVMTVPMAFGDDLRSNWIVGETITEFLALGIDNGYSTLEQLAYDPHWPAQIEGRRGTRPPVLERLAVELGLVPWEDVTGRLEALHERYAPTLSPCA